MKLLSIVLVLLFVPAGAALTRVDPVELTEWPVPWEKTRPRDPYVENEHRVWFVGQAGDYLAYLDPTTGKFTRYDLDDGVGPHNLIVDTDGSVWYAGNLAAHIGKLDPATGAIKKYPMPDPAARDPHTLAFDARGHIWFTVQSGNFVGRLNKATGEIDLIAVPTPSARPYGIVINSKGEPWIAEFGTHKLATVNPDTLKITEIALPRAAARPRRLVVDSHDVIWYVDYAKGMLGRYDPADRKLDEWQTPGGEDAQPYGMALDDRGRIWFVESGLDPNRFVGFDPAASNFFGITEIESGGGTVRNMFHYAPAREIWFGTDTNTIGRARIP